ncbi:MAG: hypothetical protein QMD04_14575, partial [Anaerolineales bacterium]|nr:hypothetical protein [Anaerolineales bacterium]
MTPIDTSIPLSTTPAFTSADSTSTPAPHTPTLAPVDAEIMRFCPEKRDVTIAELNLPIDYTLIVTDYDRLRNGIGENEIIAISAAGSFSDPIPGTRSDANTVYRFESMGPDHSRMLLSKHVWNLSGEEYREDAFYWSLSIDGKERQDLFTYTYLGSSEAGTLEISLPDQSKTWGGISIDPGVYATWTSNGITLYAQFVESPAIDSRFAHFLTGFEKCDKLSA